MDKLKPEEKLEIDAVLSEIPSIEVTSETLKLLNSEDEFMHLTVELAKETGMIVSLVADFVINDSGKMERNQAVIVGNIVRLGKLISAQIDQVCQKRQEISFILSRLVFETIVNIKFLIQNSSSELFNSYIEYSMWHEKELRDLILENIKKRNGKELPIERRMLDSIERTAKASGVDMDKMSGKKPQSWGDKNLFDKANNVGLGPVYLAAYGGGSHTVHGNWKDLLMHHLEYLDPGFVPRLSWNIPKPQILLSTMLLSMVVIQDYFAHIGMPPIELINERVKSLIDKIRTVDSAHESFISSKSG